jgi:DNA-binding CsgD family transcriptional regulator
MSSRRGGTMSAAEIARELDITPRTVQRHRGAARRGHPVGKIKTPFRTLVRYQQIIALRDAGYSRRQIAQRLGISDTTITRARRTRAARLASGCA